MKRMSDFPTFQAPRRATPINHQMELPLAQGSHISLTSQATAPEHLRNAGRPLDPMRKFMPFENPADSVMLDDVEATNIPVTLSVDAFRLVINEFAALFKDPETRVLTEHRTRGQQLLRAPEPISHGDGRWTLAPSHDVLASLERANWETYGGGARPLITTTEVTTDKERAKGKRYFVALSNYTCRYDTKPIKYKALMVGQQREVRDHKCSGRIEGVEGAIAETKALWLELEQTILSHDRWTDHAIDQAEDREVGQDNSTKIILSLFDLSGEWGQPWADAGYNVIPIDIQDGLDVHQITAEYLYDEMGVEGEIYGILAATPCTDFATSGSRHFAAKDADGRTEASKDLVIVTLELIQALRPKFWVLENPVGRIENLTGLPKARMTFDPWQFGHPYTKKTVLWGNFNTDLPLSPVEPVLGSKMHSKYGGKSMATKNARSETPSGFAKAFFMANNYADLPPEQSLTADYPEAAGAVLEALKVGVTPPQIHRLMEGTYGNYEYAQARNILIEAVAIKMAGGDLAALGDGWDEEGEADEHEQECMA